MCGQCLCFGVFCNHDPSIPDLQPRSAASNVVRLSPVLDKSPLLTTQPVLDMVNGCLAQDSLGPTWGPRNPRFDIADLARLDKFQMRTVLTIGVSSVARLFQKEVLRLACTHRFLMHLVQAVTASHDRYLCQIATSRPCAAETYHMSQALASFQTILSRPIHPGDRDSLMIGASLLSVVTFFNLEAASLEDVWPLADCDLSWLSISDGKKTVWRLAGPLDKESLWRNASKLYDGKGITKVAEITPRPSIFDHLYRGDSSAGPYKSARELVRLLDMEPTEDTWLEFLSFTCHIDPPLKELLACRDPWALLMLCYWYMKVCRAVWWVASRCIVQGLAICLYLERHHPDDAAVQSALCEPRREFEAAQKDGYGGVSPAFISPEPTSSLEWLWPRKMTQRVLRTQ